MYIWLEYSRVFLIFFGRCIGDLVSLGRVGVLYFIKDLV